jgi:UDP-N-acetylmuramate dehydrogenase
MTLDGNLRGWLLDCFGQRVRFDEPMAGHTTLRVGGPADAFVMPGSPDELQSLLGRLREDQIPYWVVGDGTNLLVADDGLQGVVITLAPHFNAIAIERKNSEAVTVSAMAGSKLNAVCRFAIEKGLKGFNFALGIPGTVGGALAMNAGTRWGAMADILKHIKVMVASGRVETVERKDLEMTYRKTSLPRSMPEAETAVILEGCFRLVPDDAEMLRQDAHAILVQRKEGQPTSLPSAGCYFKNPSPEKPAGLLIDQAGLKGERVGNAMVSEKHANFIVNTGGATARDILELAARIQKRVMARFKVKLDPEVVILGVRTHG